MVPPSHPTRILILAISFTRLLTLARSSPLATSTITSLSYDSGSDHQLILESPSSRPPGSEELGLNETSLSFTEYDFVNGESPPLTDTIGWIDPRLNGGRFLDYTTKRLGEPLNVIISASSDPYVLTEEGLHMYTKSIGFSEECLGLHYGHIHEADLGDGLGRKSEQFLARQHYFPVIGTCWESVRGGQHFRAWKQNGTAANSGAWFIAASKEQDSSKRHKITEDGYNRGRDYIVERATTGGRWKGMWWKAEVEWKEGLLQRGKRGINHGIEQDGRVAILTEIGRAHV